MDSSVSFCIFSPHIVTFVTALEKWSAFLVGTSQKFNAILTSYIPAWDPSVLAVVVKELVGFHIFAHVTWDGKQTIFNLYFFYKTFHLYFCLIGVKGLFVGYKKFGFSQSYKSCETNIKRDNKIHHQGSGNPGFRPFNMWSLTPSQLV